MNWIGHEGGCHHEPGRRTEGMEKDNGQRRNPGQYYFSIFGTPSGHESRVTDMGLLMVAALDAEPKMNARQWIR